MKYRFGYTDEELNKVYSTVDVTLNVTAGEGYGLPIVESMASGNTCHCGWIYDHARTTGLGRG